MTWTLDIEETQPRRGAHPQYGKARERVKPHVDQYKLHLQGELNAGRLDPKADLEFSFWAAVENLAPPHGFAPAYVPRPYSISDTKELEDMRAAELEEQVSLLPVGAAIFHEGPRSMPGMFVGWHRPSAGIVPVENVRDQFIPLFEPVEVKVRFRPKWVP